MKQFVSAALVLLVAVLAMGMANPQQVHAGGGLQDMYSVSGEHCWGGPSWNNASGVTVTSCVVLDVYGTSKAMVLNWSSDQIAVNGTAIGLWSDYASGVLMEVWYSNGTYCAGRSVQAFLGTVAIMVTSPGHARIQQGPVSGQLPDCTRSGNTGQYRPPGEPPPSVTPGQSVINVGKSVLVGREGNISINGVLYTNCWFAYAPGDGVTYFGQHSPSWPQQDGVERCGSTGTVVAYGPPHYRMYFDPGTPVDGGWIYIGGRFVGYSCFIIASDYGYVDMGSPWPRFYPGAIVPLCGTSAVG